jgi:DNA helicase-2/ATP-dependent DNA helicase PcrA
MTENILNGLSDIQKEAVTYDKGPLLVLAGPGAGKTTVLTKRIAYILNKTRGEQFKILALTFTNKAAKEMRDRVEILVGEEVKRTFIGTFHGFCHDVLKSYGEYIGLNPEFTIYDKHEDLIALLIDAVKKRVQEEREGKVFPAVLLERYQNVRVIENTIPSFYFAYIRFKNKLIDPTISNLKPF